MRTTRRSLVKVRARVSEVRRCFFEQIKFVKRNTETRLTRASKTIPSSANLKRSLIIVFEASFVFVFFSFFILLYYYTKRIFCLLRMSTIWGSDQKSTLRSTLISTVIPSILHLLISIFIV